MGLKTISFIPDKNISLVKVKLLRALSMITDKTPEVNLQLSAEVPLDPAL